MKNYKEALKDIVNIINATEKSDIGFVNICSYLDANCPELMKSKDDIMREKIIATIHLYYGEPLEDEAKDMIAWLKKLGEQQSLYIRFGDIPSNEKSKIYRGEEEIGEEDGVSVYPAFEVNGNIVLGLTLPITKTTLYTQQHLLEYENRPCYLVKGDYIGKDADGQPLICNVQIIKKIDNYRVKEEKADNANGYGNPTKPATFSEQESVKVNKAEPKFQPGDWVVREDDCSVHQIKGCFENLNNHTYYYELTEGGHISSGDINKWHLWTFNDAKDTDVLIDKDGHPFIFNGYFTSQTINGYCGLVSGMFISGVHLWIKDVKPATREQRNLLEKAMAEAGYTFDFEKGGLNKITKFKIGDWVVEPREDEPNKLWHIEKIEDGFYWNGYAGVSIECADKYYHIWTLENDANDGDILVIDGDPFIYKGCLDPDHPNSPVAYCGINSVGQFCCCEEDDGWWTNNEVYPATEEQCNLLFQKMEEDGYEWDAENKKLNNKKI